MSLCLWVFFLVVHASLGYLHVRELEYVRVYCFTRSFLYQRTRVSRFNIVCMCVIFHEPVSSSPVSQDVWAVTECVSLCSSPHNVWINEYLICWRFYKVESPRYGCHHTASGWYQGVCVDIMCALIYLAVFEWPQCVFPCLSCHRVFLWASMFQRAECESLCWNCHHEYITVCVVAM